MKQARGEPILISCEGSGCPGNPGNPGNPGDGEQAMCMVCGWWVLTGPDGNVAGHERDDIIARIKRGDFG